MQRLWSARPGDKCGGFLRRAGFVPDQIRSALATEPNRSTTLDNYSSSRDALLKEVLALTKLNWNSAALGGLLPITIKLSGLVVEIMREIPADREPLPQFKFYI
jgi:hypothetical protein